MNMETRTVEIGQIYRIKADERNEITPKGGMSFRPTKSKYPFLSHDSYIDCRKMKPSRLESLLEGDYCGNILEDDFSNIVKLLKMSPMETYVRLRAYGLL